MIRSWLDRTGNDYLELPIGCVLCMGAPQFLAWLAYVGVLPR